MKGKMIVKLLLILGIAFIFGCDKKHLEESNEVKEQRKIESSVELKEEYERGYHRDAVLLSRKYKIDEDNILKCS
jgi:hypothetical protein